MLFASPPADLGNIGASVDIAPDRERRVSARFRYISVSSKRTVLVAITLIRGIQRETTTFERAYFIYRYIDAFDSIGALL